MAWTYSTRYGLELTTDVSARLGMTVGDDFAFLYDSELYENFTVTDEGITGDLVNFGQSTQVLSCRSINGGEVKEITFPTNWEILNVTGSVRIAAYVNIISDGLFDGRVDLALRFYAEEMTEPADTINVSVDGAGNYPIASRQLDSETMDVTYMQSPGSYGTLQLSLSAFAGGNDNYAWRLTDADYFDWTKKATNIPVFDTEEHCDAYLMDSTNETTEGLLNAGEEPDEEYAERFKYWYVRNIIGKNTRVIFSYTNERNYRFFPQSKQKICFLKKTATASDPYDLVLQRDYNYTVKKAGALETDDEDYEVYTGGVQNKYLSNSKSFGNDYYTTFIFDTNIPVAESQEDIDDYFAGRKTIDEIAINWSDIARKDDYLLDPDWDGTEKDSETDTGSNGMIYTYGSKLYEVTNLALAALFNELFDPNNLQDILDGNKLFSSETLACVNSITYFPLTSMSEVCDMGGTGNVWIGSWMSENCQGTRINKNNKKINIGTLNMTPTYNDFRDFEPYTKLYIQLPFAGNHELTISKYMGKVVKVEASIDITTGTILYMLYGNNILLDMFSGTCGAQRPFTARDSAQYISNVMNAVTGASSTMTSAANSANSVANGISAVSAAGLSTGAVAAGGVVAGGLVAGAGAIKGIYKAYGIKNAIDSPPLISTGSLAGCAAYSANTKVCFIVAQKKTVVPSNLQTILGRPSNQGGTVGSFTGYLKCSSFNMANFTGTKVELDEIYRIMAEGIYI